MATKRKSTKKPAKKTAKKRKTQSHSLKAIRKTSTSWIEAGKDYNEKYVLKPFETGKDFVEEMQKDPSKTIEGLIDDGKNFIKDVTEDPGKVFNGFFEDGKDFVEDLRDDFRSGIDDFIDGGKDFYKGLQKDTRKAFETVASKRKNLTDKIPMVNTIEEGVTKALNSVPDRLNLPNKKDMEALAKTVKTLNRKINALSKAQAA